MNVHVISQSFMKRSWQAAGRPWTDKTYTMSTYRPLSKTVSEKLCTQASRTQGKPLSETSLSQASKETSSTQGKQSKRHTWTQPSSSRHRSLPNRIADPCFGPMPREGSDPQAPLQTGWRTKETNTNVNKQCIYIYIYIYIYLFLCIIYIYIHLIIHIIYKDIHEFDAFCTFNRIRMIFWTKTWLTKFYSVM